MTTRRSFRTVMGSGWWKDMLMDHGYNASPISNMIAAFLTNIGWQDQVPQVSSDQSRSRRPEEVPAAGPPLHDDRPLALRRRVPDDLLGVRSARHRARGARLGHRVPLGVLLDGRELCARPLVLHGGRRRVPAEARLPVVVRFRSLVERALALVPGSARRRTHRARRRSFHSPKEDRAGRGSMRATSGSSPAAFWVCSSFARPSVAVNGVDAHRSSSRTPSSTPRRRSPTTWGSRRCCRTSRARSAASPRTRASTTRGRSGSRRARKPSTTGAGSTH